MDFQLIMFSIFGLMFFIAYSNNFELNYYKCPSPAPNDFIKGMPPTLIGMGLTGDQNTNCINPFYKAPDWTNEKTLPPGEYGFIPGPLFNNVGTIATVLFIIGLLLNHLIYNKSFFKKGGFDNGYNNNNN